MNTERSEEREDEVVAYGSGTRGECTSVRKIVCKRQCVLFQGVEGGSIETDGQNA